MKKVIAVFMAVLMALGCFSFAVMADDNEPETPAAAVEEPTTRNIMNEDGLVVPLNFTQLKESVIFKIFEKIFKAILSFFDTIFGDGTGGNIDEGVAGGIEDVGDALDEILSNVEDILNNQQ